MGLSRQFTAIVAALSAICLGRALLAEETSVFQRGDYVMPREGCEMRRDGQVVSLKGRITPFIVQTVQGTKVDLGFGETDATELVSIDDAVEYYTAWIAREPQSIDAYHLRAMAYAGMKTLDKETGRRWLDQSINDLSKAIELAPSIARLYTKRGGFYAIYEDQGGRRLYHDRALKDAEQALRLDPDEVWAVCVQRMVYDNMGDSLQSHTLLVRMLRHTPRDEMSCYRVGKAHFVNGKYTAAVQYFTQALEMNPCFPEAYIDRGRAYFEMKDYRRALDDNQRAVEVDPQEVGHRMSRATTLFFLKREKAALAELAEIAELAPKRDDIAIEYAAKLIQSDNASLRNGAVALEHAKRGYEISQKYYNIYILGCCYAETGDFQKAREMMLRLLEMTPTESHEPSHAGVQHAIQRFAIGLCNFHN